MSVRESTRMDRIKLDRSDQVAGWIKPVLALCGLAFALTALTQLFAPEWFFNVVGTFPPFNRHYVGDLGAFLLPLGAGLVFAARNPLRHRGIVGVAAAGSSLHALNHFYDDLRESFSGSHWLNNTLPLLLVAVVLIVAYLRLAQVREQ